jgi:beta-lactamase class D
MKIKRFQLLIITVICFGGLSSQCKCFLAVENNKVLVQEGDCKTRHSPCSSFKIALALMGYDAKFLKDEDHPRINFQEGFTDWMSAWRQPHTPKLWIKNSCVWYSQEITKALGFEKFKEYLERFDYGNKKINKETGLVRSWISDTIQISPKEQSMFIDKLLNQKLKIDHNAYTRTKQIIYKETIFNGWKVYGKTGTGHNQRKDGTKIMDQQIGWFVGWIETQERKIIIVNFVEKDFSDVYDAGLESYDRVRDYVRGI